MLVMEHTIFKPRRIKKRIKRIDKYVRENYIVDDLNKTIKINDIVNKSEYSFIWNFKHPFTDYTVYSCNGVRTFKYSNHRNMWFRVT